LPHAASVASATLFLRRLRRYICQNAAMMPPRLSFADITDDGVLPRALRHAAQASTLHCARARKRHLRGGAPPLFDMLLMAQD